MLQRKWLAVPILSVALVAVWGGAEVQAQGTPPLFTKFVAPLFCTTAQFPAGSGKSLTVTAVPGTNGDFPVPVLCPGELAGGKQCSQYEYSFHWTGVTTADDAIVSVSTNVDLYSATASAGPPGVIENPANRGDSETLLGAGIWEQRTVRFDGHTQDLHTFIITSPSIPIPGTVAGTGRSGFIPFFATCMIQVPGQGALGSQDTVPAGFLRFKRPNGKEVCALVNPVTQCETPVDCVTGIKLAGTGPLSDFINIKTSGDAKTSSTPNAACSTFSLDDGQEVGTSIRCSGGICIKYP